MANTTSTPDPLDTFGLVPTAVGAVHGAALNAAFFSFDVCLATTFVLFSTPTERRSAIFWLHIFSFGCAGAFFFIQIGTQPSQIFLTASQKPDGDYDLGISLDLARWNAASFFFLLFAPLVADSSLFFKLNAIYPSWATSRVKQCLVLGPFIVALIVRLILSFLTIWYSVGLITPKIESGGSINDVYGETHVFEILRALDIGLQFLSCAYVSALILLRAHRFRKQRRARSRHQELVGGDRPWRKLNHLIESILMSFVPPLLCQVMIVVSLASIDYLAATAIQTYAGTANVFLSALFAVLATTWSTVRDAIPRRSSSTRDSSTSSHYQTSHNRTVVERSIISNFLERNSGVDDDDEEEMEFVGTTPSITDEGVSTPPLPLKGTSQWRTHLFGPLGSKQPSSSSS
ncbi:hypothetical protein FA10DRAFT_270115 [Acaromyces ingoldii]|uniref:Uncharacterized protein n=1 Tax=Acaromyces ingoldii TaxID=215250 RepID=A0A316YA48_9BASI|nr:hypothetical protein FA10DRAFT_270115 [Acaromyces ingoldii]PWN86557.1 hypothetical protein FA10DRAFT_270115 [Acaromyces ingoldii]